MIEYVYVLCMHRKNAFICLVLETLVGMLADPSTDSPLEPEIAECLVKDRKKFDKTAKQWTKKHAK